MCWSGLGMIWSGTSSSSDLLHCVLAADQVYRLLLVAELDFEFFTFLEENGQLLLHDLDLVILLTNDLILFLDLVFQAELDVEEGLSLHHQSGQVLLEGELRFGSFVAFEHSD